MMEAAVLLLQQGQEIRVTLGGVSMWPWLRKGDVVVVKPFSPPEEPRTGDVVVFCSGTKLIAHRLLKRIENKGKTQYLTKGDALLKADHLLEREQLLGRIEVLERKGNSISCRNSKALAGISRLTVPLYFVIHLSNRIVLKMRKIIFHGNNG